MASYKLYYYDVRGRAENIRLLFAQAGVKYEDIRFGKEEWTAKYKSGMPHPSHTYSPYPHLATISVLIFIIIMTAKPRKQV